jgi:CRISPR-associated protein Cas2
MRKTYLVCYDICDDRRLAKVHKTLRGFGDHLQYSIFECQLTPADLGRCRHRLGDIHAGRQSGEPATECEVRDRFLRPA